MPAMSKVFMYTCLVKDARGVICTKEGDIPGNNVLHAVKAIENICNNTWQGSLYQIVLKNIRFDTGEIESDPIFVWNKNGGLVRDGSLLPDQQRKLCRDLNTTAQRPLALPEPKGDKTSHGVSFDPTEIGSVVTYQRPTYTVYSPKET